jgi:Holliday junction resolvase
MRDQHAAAKKAWKRIRAHKILNEVHASEVKSKRALRKYCKKHGWHVAFFEGRTGAPRTGIIDAIAYRLGKQNPDEMDLRLIQLKGGKAGVTGEEIRRLKEAAENLRGKPLIAEFDGKALQFLPNEPD